MRGVFVGGSCTETDLSARASVQLAVAAGADQVLAKPGMGVDEAVAITRNEMQRVCMLISRIDAFPIAYPRTALRRPSALDHARPRRRPTDGAVGWGEANTRFREASLATRVLVLEGFAPRLDERDPREVEELWREMCDYAFWFGVEGIAAFAISAIDMALWDLKGKLEGQPVADLLGDRAARMQCTAMAAIILDMRGSGLDAGGVPVVPPGGLPGRKGRRRSEPRGADRPGSGA